MKLNISMIQFLLIATNLLSFEVNTNGIEEVNYILQNIGFPSRSDETKYFRQQNYDDGEIRTHALIEQWISNPSP